MPEKPPLIPRDTAVEIRHRLHQIGVDLRDVTAILRAGGSPDATARQLLPALLAQVTALTECVIELAERIDVIASHLSPPPEPEESPF